MCRQVHSNKVIYCQAQYGMDNQGNFREQSLTNMQKAVYAGEMSVADYYERQIELRAAESNGVDDGSSCTKGKIIDTNRTNSMEQIPSLEVITANSRLCSSQISRVLMHLARISKKFYHLIKLLQKQSCDMYMVIHHVVLTTTTTAACHPLSHRCHYSHCDA